MTETTPTGTNASSQLPQNVKLEEFKAALDRFEKELGLPPLKSQVDSEATRLLELSKSELRGLTEEDCFEGAVILGGFAFHLQRAANRARSVVSWCDENVRTLIAPIVGSVKGWAYEERRPLAVAQKESARRLEVVRVQYQSRMQSIEYLSSKVEQQALFLRDLGHTKRKHNNG